MRCAPLAVVVTVLGCGSTPAASDLRDGSAPDSSTIADASAMDSTVADAAPDAFAGPTIHFRATAVQSPSGAPIPGVTACAYAEPGIPCVTSDAVGFFDVPLPALSETGVTLAVTGRESVLLPIVTTMSNQSGYQIGMSDVARMTTFAVGLGLTFPPTTTGFLVADLAAPGMQLGIAGITSAIAPRSGSGPLYLTSSGAPDPTATSTSTYSATFFGNVTPGVVTVTFAPVAPSTALSCHLYFGGWPAGQPNSVRVPVAAGFDTHVAMECMATAADAGTPADSGAGDGAAD